MLLQARNTLRAGQYKTWVGHALGICMLVFERKFFAPTVFGALGVSVALTGSAASTEVSPGPFRAGEYAAGCSLPQPICGNSHLALLDPPRDVEYTTRAPVATPLASRMDADKSEPRENSRRATTRIPAKATSQPQDGEFEP